MTETENIERLSNPYAKIFLIAWFLIGAAIFVVYLTKHLDSLRVVFAYMLPFAVLGSIILMARLYWLGRNPIPKMALIVGLAFVAGGALLDVGATIVKTPTLDLEGNPLARALLDSGHSLTFVYVGGALWQVLSTVLVGLLWAAFLRHRLTLVSSAMEAQPQSRAEFIKAALGGAHITWRQCFFTLKLSAMPKSYHLIWLVAAMLMGMAACRWYLGLSWLGVIDISDAVALVIITVLSASAYFAWLWLQYPGQPSEKIESVTII